MGTVNVLTAEKTLEIANQSIVSGTVDSTGHLILTNVAGTNFDAGNVKGDPVDPNHTHDASDIVSGVLDNALFPARLQAASEDLTGTNLLNTQETGFYWGSNVTGAPDANAWFFQVVARSGTYINYTAFEQNGPRIYRGRVQAGVWQGWDVVRRGADIPWTQVPYASGYTAADAGVIQYRREKDIVFWRGTAQGTYTSATYTTVTTTGQIPGTIIPLGGTNIRGGASGDHMIPTAFEIYCGTTTNCVKFGFNGLSVTPTWMQFTVSYPAP